MKYFVLPLIIIVSLVGFSIWSIQDIIESNQRLDSYLFERYTTNQTAINEISCDDIELIIAVGAQIFNVLPKSIPILQDIAHEKECVFQNSHWWDV